MKIRILAAAVIAVLAFTAVAFAKTNNLTGKIKSPGAGSVTIKVKLSKKGVVKKVTAVNIKNFTTYCLDKKFNHIPSKTIASAKLGKMKITKVKQSGKTYYTFGTSPQVDGVQYNVEASFSSKKGKKASGTLSLNYPNAEGSASCEGGGKFSAKVK